MNTEVSGNNVQHPHSLVLLVSSVKLSVLGLGGILGLSHIQRFFNELQPQPYFVLLISS